MPDAPANSSSLILYQAEDGQTRGQCRFGNVNLLARDTLTPWN